MSVLWFRSCCGEFGFRCGRGVVVLFGSCSVFWLLLVLVVRLFSSFRLPLGFGCGVSGVGGVGVSVGGGCAFLVLVSGFGFGFGVLVAGLRALGLFLFLCLCLFLFLFLFLFLWLWVLGFRVLAVLGVGCWLCCRVGAPGAGFALAAGFFVVFFPFFAASFVRVRACAVFVVVFRSLLASLLGLGLGACVRCSY